MDNNDISAPFIQRCVCLRDGRDLDEYYDSIFRPRSRIVIAHVGDPLADVLPEGQPDSLHPAGESGRKEIDRFGRESIKLPAEEPHADWNGVACSGMKKLTREMYLLPESVRRVVAFSRSAE